MPNASMLATDRQTDRRMSSSYKAPCHNGGHSLLLERLHSEFAVTDTSLWLRSYLVDRVQFVKMGRHQSDTIPLDVGVPQGSVLGPLLFAVYCRQAADCSRASTRDLSWPVSNQTLLYSVSLYAVRLTSPPTASVLAE